MSTSSVRRLLKNLRCGGSLSCGRKRKLESELINVKSKQVKLKHGCDKVKWLSVISAFRNRIQTGVVINFEHTNPVEFLEAAFVLVKSRLQKVLKKTNCVKVNFVFTGDFIKPPDRETACRRYINTKNYKLYRCDRVEDTGALTEILEKLGEFQERGSGLALREIINLCVNINSVCEYGG